MSMVQRRILFLLLMLLGAVVLLGGRLAYLQLWQNEFYQAKALEQRLQRIPIEGLRGGIYDRNGVPLAVSVSAHTVYAIPAEVEDAEATAQKLAAIPVSYTHLTRLQVSFIKTCHLIAEELSRERRFFGHGNITRTACGHDDLAESVRSGQFT